MIIEIICWIVLIFIFIETIKIFRRQIKKINNKYKWGVDYDHNNDFNKQ